MPSIVELNTNTTEFYEVGLPEDKQERHEMNHIILCYNYLRNLDSGTCTAEGILYYVGH